MSDHQSLSLCARLYMEDLLAVRAAAQRSGSGDFAYCCELFELELRQLDESVADMSLAVSLDNAVESDSAIVTSIHLDEERAGYDHEVALALSEGREAPGMPVSLVEALESVSVSVVEAEVVKEAAISDGRTTEVGATGDMTEADDQGNASEEEVNFMIGGRGNSKPKLKCAACLENLTSKTAIHVFCGHHYDAGCLRELYMQATADETLMPPRCCGQSIDINLIEAHLSEREYELFICKKEEWSTNDRLYCPDPRCAIFLGAAPKDGAVQPECHTCGTLICLDCRGVAHAEQGECKGDEALQEVLTLGAAEGWKRCQKCGSLVELNFGCFHMTCRSRYQFCYQCGVKWKECACEFWNENRLEAAVQQRVERDFAHQAPVVEAVQQVRLDVARRQLLVHDGCGHRRWRCRGGGGPCEGCSHWLPHYLFLCMDCVITDLIGCPDCPAYYGLPLSR